MWGQDMALFSFINLFFGKKRRRQEQLEIQSKQEEFRSRELLEMQRKQEEERGRRERLEMQRKQEGETKRLEQIEMIRAQERKRRELLKIQRKQEKELRRQEMLKVQMDSVIRTEYTLQEGTSDTEVSDEVEELRAQYKLLFNLTNKEIDQYCSLEIELSEELKEEYSALANQFMELLIEGINGIKKSQRNNEILKMRFNFYGDKRVILEIIASKYGLSRERVRQIVNIENCRLTKAFRENSNRELIDLKLIINYFLRPDDSDFEKRFILLLYYGFQSTNTQVLIKLLTELIIGKQYENGIQDSYENFIDELNRRLLDNNKIRKKNRSFDTRIGNRIHWFENVSILTEKDYLNIMPVREVNVDIMSCLLAETSTAVRWIEEFSMSLKWKEKY